MLYVAFTGGKITSVDRYILEIHQEGLLFGILATKYTRYDKRLGVVTRHDVGE
jgi:hypothetical protein